MSTEAVVTQRHKVYVIVGDSIFAWRNKLFSFPRFGKKTVCSFENMAKRGERNVLMLGYICFPRYMQKGITKERNDRMITKNIYLLLLKCGLRRTEK